MALLKAISGLEATAVIRSGRLILRHLQMGDYPAWAEVRSLSREHLTPWEPAWLADELSRSSYRRRVRHYQRESREDLGYAFGVFAEGGTLLIGGLSFSNVRRGVTQAATVGYWLGQPYVGRGFMTEALRAGISFAFNDLRLHRLEAASMPSNSQSIKVLERTGFVREGLARRYLKINNAWEDHILFALLVEDVARGAADNAQP